MKNPRRQKKIVLYIASEFWDSKSVGWFVVETLRIHGQEDTQMIGNSANIGFALHKKSGKKWDL
jgi:hypothetical protein